MAIKNVMVVDDSPTEVHLLREMLTKNGFTVSVASSGEEAITRAASEKPDLILMDVVMPGMSGRELAERLAQARPGTRVLFMSGYAADTMDRHGVTEGGIAARPVMALHESGVDGGDVAHVDNA